MIEELQPITRDVLGVHFDKHPLEALPDAFEQKLEELRARVLQRESCMPPTLPYHIISAPKRLDENFYRNRELCESIAEYCAGKEALKAIGSQASTGDQCIRQFQDDRRADVEKLINNFVPNDWRLRMMRKRQAKGEKASKEALEKLAQQGGSLHAKYDLLWQQQMDRRAQLVKVGEASGLTRFVIRHVAGIPQVMLDFLKTINDINGPMEEMRLRYGPQLYTLTEYADVLHRYMRSGCIDEDENLDAFQAALTDYLTQLRGFVTVVNAALTSAPFFLTAEDAERLLQGKTQLGAHQEVTIPPKTSQAVAISWENILDSLREEEQERGGEEEPERGEKRENVAEGDSDVLFWWDIKVAAHDINVTMHLASADGEPSTQPHIHTIPKLGTVPVVGYRPLKRESLLATTSRQLLITFDNSYSKWRSKTVQYRAGFVFHVEDLPFDNDNDNEKRNEEEKVEKKKEEPIAAVV